MFPARAAIGFVLVSTAAVAQQYVISTVAGGAPPPTPVAAVSASFAPVGLTLDGSGNVYVSGNNSVFRLDKSGVLTRIAGNGRGDYSGDGQSATTAQLYGPHGLAMDANGNIFVQDTYNMRIRRISPAGTITTVAGDGTNDHSGDGGPATKAHIAEAGFIAVDGSGNVFLAEQYGNTIRKISVDGTITTPIGTGAFGYSGDGGPASAAQLSNPTGIAIDAAGNIYFADSGNQRIRKVSAAGVISTIGGNGIQGYSGDGGSAVTAQLSNPQGVAVDAAGNVYVGDYGNNRIRKISVNGTITTIAGTGGFVVPDICGIFPASGDGSQAVTAPLTSPYDVKIDSAGNIYITEEYRLRIVSPNGLISSLAGNGCASYSGDGGLAASAQLNSPYGVALDANHNLFISDYGNYRIRKLSAAGNITTVAGMSLPGFSGDGGAATSARIGAVTGIAVDSAGNIYFADWSNFRIRRVSQAGIINTIAGTGTHGYSGDGGPATSAQLDYTEGVAVDKDGNVYVSDIGNCRVRKISVTGVITTVAGNGTCREDSGDGGKAVNASVSGPRGLAFDPAGNLYVSTASAVRKISTDGVITTVAGTASMNVAGIAFDTSGILYMTAGGPGAGIGVSVRKVDLSGNITIVAGNCNVGCTVGYSGDGGPATKASLNGSTGLSVDAAGNIYFADQWNNAIRLLQATGPALSVNAVTNGASNLPGPIAPGEIVVLYGSGLGPAQLTQFQIGPSGLVGTQLAGTQVSFNGTPAPIIYTWATQVAAIVPYSVSGSTTQVTVTYQGQTTTPMPVAVAPSAPGIFTLDSTGKGAAAVVNQDGSINTAATPAKVGDYVAIFATGEGQTAPPGVDGRITTVASLPQPILPVSVTIGGQTVQPQYAGGAPSEVAGVLQVNVQIPTGIQTGNAVPVVLKVGNASSQAGLPIAVR